MMNNKVAYPIIVIKNKNDYLVNVPDLELFTEGKSLIDAIEMARDIIGLHCMDLCDKKIKLPFASTYDEALKICKKKNPEYKNGTLTMVDVNIDKYREKLSKKTVRRNVTIPKYLNEAANKADINVSKVLTNALLKYLKLT